MGTRAYAALFGLLLLGQALAAPPTPEERYVIARNVLLKGCGGNPGCAFDVDTKEESAALAAIWSATQDWTVAFLNDHPDIRGERLTTELLNRQDGPAPTQIVAIAPQLYAAFAQLNEMGNVFLLREKAGRVFVVWDIRQVDPAAFPILAAWRADAAIGTCRSNAKEEGWGRCGPLFPFDIKLLPPDQHGHPRFYLNATYAQAAETTVGAQISVWRLENDVPRVVWAKPYAYNFEDESWRLNGEILRIRTTDWWHSLFACGTCIGRQMNWTIRVRPNGIDDLGVTPVVPELDAFDQLAWRTFNNQKVDELASRDVAHRMATIVREQVTSQKKLMGKDYDPKWFSFGMLAGQAVHKVRNGTELCVVTDDGGFDVRFTDKGGRLFAVEMKELPEPDSKFCFKPQP